MCVYVSVYVCVFVCMSVSMCLCVYVSVYVCMFVCMCISMRMYVCVCLLTSSSNHFDSMGSLDSLSPSIPISLLCSIQCLHRANLYKFLLVCPSVGVHRTSLTCLSLLHQKFLACLIHFTLIMKWKVHGCIAAALRGATSKICSEQHTSFLCSSHQAFSSGVSLKFMLCNHSIVLTYLQLRRISDYI